MRGLLFLIVVPAAASFGVAFAHAQTVGSNEVYLGQTGDTNTVTIEQTGNGNLIGENDEAFRLNQLGDDNAITIDQYGYANTVGSRLRQGTYASNGIDQRGDRNQLTVDQVNNDDSSSNHLDALSQRADDSRTTPGNFIDVTQNDTGGGAGHRIGQIVQVNTSLDGAANRIVITQTEGLVAAGDVIEQTWQWGWDNFADVVQRASGNEVTTLTQYGNGNEVDIDQNEVGNFVDIVEQGNELTAGVGNYASLQFNSENNGTSANGVHGAADFTTDYGSARVPGQASVMQLGSDNTLNYTASGGPNNLYGFMQDGTGNDIAAVSSGTANEVAVTQIHDDNIVSSLQSGDENSAGIIEEGNFNALDIRQTGDRNRVRAFVVGSGNNSLTGGGFSQPALIAARGTLAPGDLFQAGDDNRISLDVTSDRNLFAISQTGSRNKVTGTVAGAANQALVIQSGDDNFAAYTQTGSRNSVLIVQ